MIKKIKKIKNLGIFSDFLWDSSLPDFKRFNSVYGWNGSGKTTLSDLFNLLETGFGEKYPDMEYTVESESGNYSQGSQYTRKVRVFNQDYIINNVQLLSCKAKPIYILGEENKKIADEIARDEKEVESKKTEIRNLEKLKSEEEKNKNKSFTDIARTISSNTSGEAIRRYNKANAETAFNSLNNKHLLNESELDKHTLTLKQLEKAIVRKIPEPEIFFDDQKLNIKEAFSKIDLTVKKICTTTVSSSIIERLRDNPGISKWVEEGIDLHNKYNSKTCEFCNQLLPKNRIEELTKYFNEEDKKLKEEIDEVIVKLNNVSSTLNSFKIIDKANLYDEIQDSYQETVSKLEIEKENLRNEIYKIIEVLNQKKTKTTETIEIELITDTDSLSMLISEANILLSNHNNKTNNFKAQKENAQKELENHYLSTIFDDVHEHDKKIKEYSDDLGKKNKRLEELKKKISDNKSKISSSHKACNAINEGIKTFLGRDEILFEVVKDGYIIKRNGVIAKNLSEGEKTAIAFVYFTVHLKDQEFDLKEGILVIDDPVSSLDTNSLFQAFAFLKNSVKDAKQVFVLTHNFDFLKLLLNWMNRIKENIGGKEYFMIQNKNSGAGRCATISELDKDLKDHESEYHYLFKILYKFESDGTIACAYHMPVIARKTMEYFLTFRVPDNNNYYKKLDSLKNKFDENKITAIYKFTNDQTHITGKGFDPSLVPETEKCVKYLLELIETTFPEHYNILVQSITT